MLLKRRKNFSNFVRRERCFIFILKKIFVLENKMQLNTLLIRRDTVFIYGISDKKTEMNLAVFEIILSVSFRECEG